MAKAKRWHANPWNIDMIFMDVLCYNVGRMDHGQLGMAFAFPHPFFSVQSYELYVS